MTDFRAALRQRLPGLALGLVMLGAATGGVAEVTDFFRIGTGSTGGTYFPIGGLIANAISNPPGSRSCEEGGSCGVPGLISVAQSTTGSVANIDAIANGELESGLSQADVAFWAYEGSGIYKKKGRVEKLRAIANLYPESVHLVVRADSGIKSIKDLRGKRISVGEKGSGTLVDAEIILRAHGLKMRNLKAQYLKLEPASDRMVAGELDGLFLVAGAPARAIVDLATRVEIKLVPITGPTVEKIMKKYRFLAQGKIAGGIYAGVGETETLTVGAQWVVSADVSEDLVYEITRALWHENTSRLLRQGHAKGEQIRIVTALTGVAIPLHPGAARFYKDAGIMNEDAEAQGDLPPAN